MNLESDTIYEYNWEFNRYFDSENVNDTPKYTINIPNTNYYITNTNERVPKSDVYNVKLCNVPGENKINITKFYLINFR
jgi:hypothetical protein